VIDEARLRAESHEIERELAELRELVVPAAWNRIEHVLRVTIALYGTGLAHALAHAKRAGADVAGLDNLVIDDDLLASLLLLHGLHPLPTASRVLRVVADLRAELGIAEVDLGVDTISDGVARLHASHNLGGGAMSAHVAAEIVRRAIEHSAPELDAIEITGLETSHPPDPSM
jgi:hypothetical protein